MQRSVMRLPMRHSQSASVASPRSPTASRQARRLLHLATALRPHPQPQRHLLRRATRHLSSWYTLDAVCMHICSPAGKEGGLASVNCGTWAQLSKDFHEPELSLYE